MKPTFDILRFRINVQYVAGSNLIETIQPLIIFEPFLKSTKGQLISKANCQAVNSSKKRTNEFIFTTMRRVFVGFLEEIEDTKKNISKLTDLY